MYKMMIGDKQRQYTGICLNGLSKTTESLLTIICVPGNSWPRRST